MHYMFVDESYSSGKGRKTVIVAPWIVEQAAYNRFFSAAPNLHRTPSLDEINSMLEALDGWAVVAWADLDENLFRAGETDGTDDIPSMSRTDNIWSECFVFALANLTAKMVHEGKDIGTVDIHYDPKSLKPEHEAAIGKSLRNMLVRAAKHHASLLAKLSGARVRLLEKLKIRRFERVWKARSGRPPGKFQTGTRVADKLCSSLQAIRAGNFKRIIFIDMSKVVTKTAQQFDGKSYFE